MILLIKKAEDLGLKIQTLPLAHHFYAIDNLSFFIPDGFCTQVVRWDEEEPSKHVYFVLMQ